MIQLRFFASSSSYFLLFIIIGYYPQIKSTQNNQFLNDKFSANLRVEVDTDIPNRAEMEPLQEKKNEKVIQNDNGYIASIKKKWAKYPLCKKIFFIGAIISFLLNIIDYEHFDYHRKVQSFANSEYYLDPLKKEVVLPITAIYLKGLGNSLGRYWYVRSFAYWYDYDFKILGSNIVTRYFSLSFCKYLPKYKKRPSIINYTSFNELSKLGIINRSNERWEFNRFPYGGRFLLLYSNKYYLDTIVRETDMAITNFLKEKGTTNLASVLSCHTVIHFRCGDILKHPHRAYPFLTQKYYHYALRNLNQVCPSGDFLNATNQKIMDNICIISQISKNGTHTKKEDDELLFSKCLILVQGIQYKIREFFPKYSVSIVNNDILTDFNTMRKSKRLICGYSTFCLTAGLANKNRCIAFPRSLYGTEKKNDAILPNSFLLIDSRERGWEVNSLSQFDIDHNISGLNNYLLSH